MDEPREESRALQPISPDAKLSSLFAATLTAKQTGGRARAPTSHKS